ncbi:putative alpha/beta superfamily hydrolase [Deinococcus sp. HSC-46F16]|uniref:alpha/beta hydrolase n=1 Tax=Deinococcus sp. HSC-46F16 TaxID=2910968 RepID=UPI00273A710B|nr:alpha/beta hydrolase-fold protein [Deinococcus sp. HSC-46F16]MCP2014972.1 putative alpha/beta superfamily hydrolase [Deinococcus sp. HSC-46F16]
MPRVLFRLHTPPPMPGAVCFLTGTHRGWSDEAEGWTFAPDGTLAAELPQGTLLNVKVRALSPDGTVTEEGDAWGGRAPAHRLVVHGDTTLDLPVAGWQDGQGGRDRPARSAPPRETVALASPWGEQPVRLWWPQDAKGDLPLLILHDGQNVFDEGPSFAGESWDAAGAAQALADAGFPCRIAALPVNEDRSRRYVPFAFELNGFESGADEYADWLRETLLPHLRGRFGDTPASRTALAGSSFGGLITAYAGLRDPGTYGTLGVFSPAIWPADFAFLRWLEGRADPQARVWLDMGDHEGDSLKGADEIVELTRDLAARLRPKVAEVHLTIGEGHWHDEEAWRARLPEFVRWWLMGLEA